MNIEIPIFKPGTHTPVTGDAIHFTDDDVAAMAQAYDPELFDAPVVIGHPEHDDPAWGWAQKLAFRDGSLWASLRDLHTGFVEMVRNKQFKKVSASFYLPNQPQNPKPGTYYLRHIGFLGAAAPSLKSLPSVSLSEKDGAIVFEEKMYFHPAINLTQSEQSDSINYMENNPMPDPKDNQNDRIKEVQDENARLRAENDQLKTQSAQFQEEATVAQKTLAERERTATHDNHAAFCEKLVEEGRLLPANQAVAVAALDLIAAQEKPLEFSEGDSVVASLTAEKFKTALQANPVVVDFSERSGDKGEPIAQHKTSVPTGFEVDPKAAELHNKALAYQEAHPGADYLTAVSAVQ